MKAGKQANRPHANFSFFKKNNLNGTSFPFFKKQFTFAADHLVKLFRQTNL